MFNKQRSKTQHDFSNKEEHINFFRSSLAWRDSVSPRILLLSLLAGLYAFLISIVDIYYFDLPHFSVTPFEYTGVVLGMVMVFRTNSGHDRWWEARKLWGNIVNQSRNLLLLSWNYGKGDIDWCKDMSKWVVIFAYATKESLRLQKNFADVKHLLTADELDKLTKAAHMPVFVSDKIAGLIAEARANQLLDDFTFLEFEKQRAALIDSLGGCERILKTPMPLVYVIKLKRFILLYMLLLPLSLLEPLGLMTAPVTFLIAYPFFSLDQIGYELQRPFATRSLSHLPLDMICNGIKSNSEMLERYE